MWAEQQVAFALQQAKAGRTSGSSLWRLDAFRGEELSAA
jgi:hypothetical protein